MTKQTISIKKHINETRNNIVQIFTTIVKIFESFALVIVCGRKVLSFIFILKQ